MKIPPIKNQLLFAAVLCLTLGLAPFNEPHIWGKLKWVWGGAIGMKGMDWFDLLLHGVPWLYLIALVLVFLVRKVVPKR